MRVVLFKGKSGLLLRDAKRDSTGRIASGWVENGGWAYKRVGDEGQAKSGNTIVNRWPQSASDERVVDVPDTVRGDYNKLIEWAERQLVEVVK